MSDALRAALPGLPRRDRRELPDGAAAKRELVRRTDEERMIAGHTLGILAAAKAEEARA
jgi:hypothetical protein